MSSHLSNIEGAAMEGKLPEVRLANAPFRVVSPYDPSGDQPQAIQKLADGVERGLRYKPFGRHGFGQNIHHGESHRGNSEAHARHGAE